MTDPIAVALVWGTLALISYLGFGYPGILWALARVRSSRGPDVPGYTPAVSLVVAVYKGAGVIEQKVANALALDYPPGKLEILVGIDGADGATAEVLGRLRDGRLRWVGLPQRAGKAAVLNHLVPHARGEVLVFSDADTMFAPDAVRRLVQPLGRPDVGVVCGRLELNATNGSPGSRWERDYWRWENRLKEWESRVGSTVAATGGIYAMRRGLYRELPEDTAVPDDLLLSVAAVAAGGRMLFAADAIGREGTPSSVRATFTRRTRIAEQNFRVLRHLWPFLAPRHGFLAFGLWSHKVLRWLTPVLLLGLLGGSAWRMGDPLYAALFLLQACWYGAGGCGLVLAALGQPMGPLSLPGYFVLANAALLAGLFRSLTMPPQPWWESTQSSA